HRDLKPENVMLTGSGNVKLMDFGIALYASAQRLTMSNVALGTVHYMAPEQFSGKAVPESDLYAVGLMLWEMLTQKPPFESDPDDGDGFQILSLKTMVGLPAPSTYRPEVPVALDQIVLKLLAPDPQDRYSTAAETISWLERVTA